MFRYLRLKREPEKVAPDASEVSIQRLVGDTTLPVSLRVLNNLPATTSRRFYRTLLPASLLTRFDINPINWHGPQGEGYVQLHAAEGEARINVHATPDAPDPYLTLELADNAYNGLDLHLLILSDPAAPRYNTDQLPDGTPTQFGTLTRNLPEEERAMQAGLAPGQVRAGLGASASLFQQLDSFLSLLAHATFFLEPLTYASAWLFERRGLAYVRGHKLMDTIHQEFQPGGKLDAALDGSTPFRQPNQGRTIRGRAWAIHDGILDVLGLNWNSLRMVKQIGRQAGVETAPGVAY
jgi:hypothetical protein